MFHDIPYLITTVLPLGTFADTALRSSSLVGSIDAIDMKRAVDVTTVGLNNLNASVIATIAINNHAKKHNLSIAIFLKVQGVPR